MHPARSWFPPLRLCSCRGRAGPGQGIGSWLRPEDSAGTGTIDRQRSLETGLRSAAQRARPTASRPPADRDTGEYSRRHLPGYCVGPGNRGLPRQLRLAGWRPIGRVYPRGRGRPQFGRPRSRPYDGRPSGLRTGSPPSPPPRSIRPTVRRLPRSPRLSGPGPHRGRCLPLARQTHRPCGAGRRRPAIRRPPIPAPWPRKSGPVRPAVPDSIS